MKSPTGLPTESNYFHSGPSWVVRFEDAVSSVKVKSCYKTGRVDSKQTKPTRSSVRVDRRKHLMK